MSETTSLCLTFQHFSDKDKRVTFRIADFAGESFKVVDGFNDNDSENFSPKRILVSPENINETPLYKPVIRKWWKVPDAPIAHSAYYDVAFYEIVNPGVHLDEKELRLRLKYGIEMPEGLSDRFFLVLSENEKAYEAVDCSPLRSCVNHDVLKIDSNCSNLDQIHHVLQKHKINKHAVFNTQQLYLKKTPTEYAKTRYFYKHITLNEPIDSYLLYDTSDYVPVIASRFLKNTSKYDEFTKNQKKKIVSLIEDALSNEIQLSKLLDLTGYDPRKIEVQLGKYREIILQSLKDNDGLSDYVKRLIDANDELALSFKKMVKEEWLKDKDKERDDIENTIAEKANDLNKIKQDLIVANKDHKLMSSKAKKIKAQYHEFSKVVQQEMKDFDVHITEHLKNYMLIDSFNSLKTENMDPKSTHRYEHGSLYIAHGDMASSNSNITTIESISDFMVDIKDNFSNNGFQSKFSEDLSKFIATSIMLRVPILSFGYFSYDLAYVVSSLMDASKPAEVFIPNDFYDYKSLLEKINSVPQKVLFIKNVFEDVNINMATFLSRSLKDKILFFDMENRELIKLLPKSIWNHVLSVDTDFFHDLTISDEDYLTAKTDLDIFNYSRGVEIKNAYSKYECFYKALKLEKPAIIHRCKIKSILDKKFEKKDFNSVLLSEAMLLFKSFENELPEDIDMDEIIEKCFGNIPDEIDQEYKVFYYIDSDE